MNNPLRIPNITKSLESDVRSGEMTIEDAAKELYAANLLPYVDTTMAKSMLHLSD